MASPTVMMCPKCHGQMTSYERNGITIEQCAECRGIFLDRGELDRLIDAEAAYAKGRPGPSDRGERHGYQRRDDDYDEYSRGHDKRRRRGGFLSDLFD